MVKLTDRPDMTLAVYHGREKTKQQLNWVFKILSVITALILTFTS